MRQAWCWLFARGHTASPRWLVVTDDALGELRLLSGYDDDLTADRVRVVSRLRDLLTTMHRLLEAVLDPRLDRAAGALPAHSLCDTRRAAHRGAWARRSAAAPAGAAHGWAARRRPQRPDCDGPRRAALPAALEFQTKPALAMEMLRACTEAGALPYQWVTADAAYGDIHDPRLQVAALGRWYCFEVSRSSEVWRQPPRWQVPASSGRGRPRSRPQPLLGAEAAERVDAIVRALPAEAWLRHRVAEGAKGPREYEFVRLRVVQKLHHEPGHEGWLMARRPVGAEPDAEVKFYLSNAPETVALPELAWVGCLRWTIEEDFELAKGEVGLDHYEVTKYRGWYHHMTLCLLALAFLKSVQLEWGKKWGAGLGPRGTPAA